MEFYQSFHPITRKQENHLVTLIYSNVAERLPVSVQLPCYNCMCVQKYKMAVGWGKERADKLAVDIAVALIRGWL